MEKHTHKEPLLRISKKDDPSFFQRSLIVLLSVAVALLVSALFINFVTKLDPISVYVSMFKGAFGTSRRTWITIRDTCLLLLISVSLAPAFRMHFWNCGAEGQVLIGGLTTAAMMIYFGDKIPTAFLLLLMIAVSAVCGGLWAFLPAVFRAKYDTNETLFTLMMNYVAIQIVEFFVDFWDRKQSHSVGIINMNTMGGWFPKIFGQQYTLNILIVLVITIFVYVYMRFSKRGYEAAVVGESIATAKYAGINVGKVIRNNVLLSGAIAGIAGFVEVAGISHTISKQKYRRRQRLHGHHRLLAGEVQSAGDDADLAFHRLLKQGRFADLFRLRSQRVCLQHHHRHHPVLHPEFGVLQQLPDHDQSRAKGGTLDEHFPTDILVCRRDHFRHRHHVRLHRRDDQPEGR